MIYIDIVVIDLLKNISTKFLKFVLGINKKICFTVFIVCSHKMEIVQIVALFSAIFACLE